MVDVHDVDCGSGPGCNTLGTAQTHQAQTQTDVCLDSNSICPATCAFEMLRFLPLGTKERITVFFTPQDDLVRGPVDTARPVGM
jgi:hypothetical protein